jgi:ribosomal protein L37AE/L43A
MVYKSEYNSKTIRSEADMVNMTFRNCLGCKKEFFSTDSKKVWMCDSCRQKIKNGLPVPINDVWDRRNESSKEEIS